MSGSAVLRAIAQAAAGGLPLVREEGKGIGRSPTYLRIRVGLSEVDQRRNVGADGVVDIDLVEHPLVLSLGHRLLRLPYRCGREARAKPALLVSDGEIDEQVHHEMTVGDRRLQSDLDEERDRVTGGLIPAPLMEDVPVEVPQRLLASGDVVADEAAQEPGDVRR